MSAGFKNRFLERTTVILNCLILKKLEKRTLEYKVLQHQVLEQNPSISKSYKGSTADYAYLHHK